MERRVELASHGCLRSPEIQSVRPNYDSALANCIGAECDNPSTRAVAKTIEAASPIQCVLAEPAAWENPIHLMEPCREVSPEQGRCYQGGVGFIERNEPHFSDRPVIVTFCWVGRS